MAVQVVGSSLMISDLTRHQARGVGEGIWVVSYLPGRMLTCEQSVAAIRVAEEVSPIVRAVGELAGELGLTAVEAMGMAAKESPWPLPDSAVGSARSRWRFGRPR